MTDLHYRILEIVYNHNGEYNQHELPHKVNEGSLEVVDMGNIVAAIDNLYRATLLRTDYVPEKNNHYVSITDKGRNTYNQKYQERNKGNQAETLKAALNEKSLEKTIQDLEIGSWLLKTKWWPHVISIGSGLIALAALILSVIWHNENKEQKTEQEQKIKGLQKQLQETRHDTYNYHDSLVKIKPTIDTSGIWKTK